MLRSELEHLIRAAGAVCGESEIVVIGSQSVLGEFPNAPSELLVSREADLYPRTVPERADLIEGALGELSMFDKTFSYYAHGVAPETAKLPIGWEDRLVPVRNENTGGVTGLCLEVHDLAIAKYLANREKDLTFLKSLIEHNMVTRQTLLERVESTGLPIEERARVIGRIQRDFSSVHTPSIGDVGR